MRIAISGMFWTEPHVGSGQYLHNLVEQFAAQPHGHRFILIIPRYLKPQKPSLPHFQTVLMPTPFDNHHDNLAKVWFEQIALPQVCRKLRADLVHIPYFGAPRYSGIPAVVTVHDLIPLLVPGNRGNYAVRLYMQLAASSARQAATIIADSRHTKDDIVKHLGIAPQRIVVTHLAASSSLRPQPDEAIEAVRERYGLAEPFVFYIGGFQAHKNVGIAIRAFARARQSLEQRVVLAIAGRLPTSQSPLFPDIHQIILEANIAADVALLGPVSEADKAALMSGCQAFVYPSRYEGFGLPPLEAMQCGAPVLASATTSVGEVIGAGGVQLPPDDLEAWTDALIRVLGDPDWRKQLSAQGLKRASEFSWQTTAAQTLAIYEQQRRDQQR